MSEYKIRSLGYYDYQQHVDLLEQLTTTKPITKEQYEKIVLGKRNTYIFVCLHEDNLVGTITLLIEQKIIHSGSSVGHIEDVVVDSEYRGKGIGRMLIDKAVAFAKKLNCYKVILDCNESKKEFYEKCGFKDTNIQMSLYFDN